MKKFVFVLLSVVLSAVQAYSQQKGDITVGARGGYVYSPNYYNGTLYGFDVSYYLSDPLEVVLNEMLNPSIPYTDILNTKKTLAVFSTNLDFRLYLLNQREWGIGPALGLQYYIVNNKSDNLDVNKAFGINMGIHGRINLTDNLQLNGGWRYTTAKTKDNKYPWDSSASFDMSYHLFYLGIAYTFESK